ncbi:hypothetical protein HaLaN_27397, partial [Haematococcus lacustris]
MMTTRRCSLGLLMLLAVVVHGRELKTFSFGPTSSSSAYASALAQASSQNQWNPFFNTLGNSFNQNPTSTSSALAQASAL